MTKKTVMTVAMLSVLALPWGVRAQDIHWDQRISVRKIVKQIGARKIRPINVQFADILDIKPWAPLENGQAPKRVFYVPAVYHPDAETGPLAREAAYESPISYASSVTQNALYLQASGLRDDQRYQSLPADVVQPLDVKWENISSIRGDLLNTAQDLDQSHDDLRQERQNFENEKQDILGEKSQLEENITSYNQDCSGQKPPDQYNACMAREGPLEARLAQHNAAAANLRGRINDYNARLATANSSLSSWQDKLQEWEGEITELINDIKTAFARNDSKYGDCTKEQHYPLQNQVSLACKNPPPLQCVESDDCDSLRAKRVKFQWCYDARKKIIDECYGGKPTDDAHQDELDKAIKGRNDCDEVISNQCGEVSLLGRGDAFSCRL